MHSSPPQKSPFFTRFSCFSSQISVSIHFLFSFLCFSFQYFIFLLSSIVLLTKQDQYFSFSFNRPLTPTSRSPLAAPRSSLLSSIVLSRPPQRFWRRWLTKEGGTSVTLGKSAREIPPLLLWRRGKGRGGLFPFSFFPCFDRSQVPWSVVPWSLILVFSIYSVPYALSSLSGPRPSRVALRAGFRQYPGSATVLITPFSYVTSISALPASAEAPRSTPSSAATTNHLPAAAVLPRRYWPDRLGRGRGPGRVRWLWSDLWPPITILLSHFYSRSAFCI